MGDSWVKGREESGSFGIQLKAVGLQILVPFDSPQSWDIIWTSVIFLLVSLYSVTPFGRVCFIWVCLLLRLSLFVGLRGAKKLTS